MTLEHLSPASPIIVGLWQLAAGHTRRELSGPEVVASYYGAGFRVFDCADIYTGVEALLGDFVAAHGLGAGDVHVHTKYVPDATALPSLSRSDTERAIDRSLARLRVGRLDLVQFHWWDYAVPGWLETLDVLADLRRDGRIGAIGLTNFDAERLGEILARGVPVASIQTQVSLLDRRARARLAPLAREHGVALLAYGSVAGGLLSERYLGAPEPRRPLENRSLEKYLLIARETGGWDALQELLRALAEIARARESDVASVATAYALQQPGVRAAIVGVRHSGHLAAHRALRDGFALSEDEMARVERARGRFPEVPGAVYGLERDPEGRHHRIMKTNLNSEG